MKDKYTVAVDGFGGDEAPDVVIEGLSRALKKNTDNVKFLLFGDYGILKSKVDKYSNLAKNVEIVHAEDVVSADMKPSDAVRKCRKSSMWQAIDAVKSGVADGVISAGNTGALMAMATISLRTIPGIHRPAITTIIPNLKGYSTVLDLGANAESSSRNLVEFAVMGSAYSRVRLGVTKPVVGLLNIGSENNKGREEIREAANVLKEAGSDLGFEFKGFVEGFDIGSGTVDVIVTDGFTGNVTLKAIEGTSKFISNVLREAVLDSSILAKIGYFLMRPAIQKMKDKVDPRIYNGALLAGVNGVVVKSHGGTDALGYSVALKAVTDFIRFEINEMIKKDLEELGETENYYALVAES